MVQSYSSNPKRPAKGQIGDRFGHWELIGFERSSKRNKLMYLCRCDCGTTRALQPGALFGCMTTSCGCSRVAIPPAPPMPTVSGIEFKTLEQYPGYAFGSDGSVWGCRARVVGRERGRWTKIRGAKDKNGYLRITITSKGDSKTIKIHTLILEAFTGPRPPGGVSRHLDGNPANNVPSNLVWGTPVENQQDSILHRTHAGLRKRGRIDEDADAMKVHVFEWVSSIMRSPLGRDSLADTLDKLGYRLARKTT